MNPAKLRWMRFLLKSLAAVLLAGAIGSFRGSAIATALAPITTDKAIVYLFWNDGCSHCIAAMPFFEDLPRRFDRVELRRYEVSHDQNNMALFEWMAAARGFEPHFVPTTFLGTRYWEGFDSGIQQEIEAAIAACLENPCPDAGLGIVDRTPAAGASPEPACDTCSLPSQTAAPMPDRPSGSGDGGMAVIFIVVAGVLLATIIAVWRIPPANPPVQTGSSGDQAKDDAKTSPPKEG